MKKLVCFGDSITARNEGAANPRLTSKLSEIFSDWQIINSGVCGNNTFDALNRIELDVLSHQPDCVIVFFGANDSAFHKMVPLEAFEANLRTIVEKIGSHKIILISPAPVNEVLQKARTNEVIKSYAKATQRVSNELNCSFIDLFTHMIQEKDYPSMLANSRNDGLHFGEGGYTFLVDLIAQKILGY